MSFGVRSSGTDPLLQFNPAYELAGSVKDIAQTGLLHHAMPDIFKGYSLYRHQREVIRLGAGGEDFVVTSGTGSGKSLTYIDYSHRRITPEREIPMTPPPGRKATDEQSSRGSRLRTVEPSVVLTTAPVVKTTSFRAES